MVAYSVKRQFETVIEIGRKRQTIRGDRKRHARPGETMQLYSGMRTAHCRLIGTATCSSVLPVSIDFDEERVVIVDQIIEARIDLDAFAWSDGFLDWEKFVAFWRKQYGPVAQWSGVIVAWKDFRKAEPAPVAPLKLRKVKP